LSRCLDVRPNLRFQESASFVSDHRLALGNPIGRLGAWDAKWGGSGTRPSGQRPASS
jgi:hypothetical protein